MQTEHVGTRQDWEISWHVFLQTAVAATKWEEATCRVIGMTKIEAVNQAIGKANALVIKHGAPGTAALSVAVDSLAVLHVMVSSGIAPVVLTTKTEPGVVAFSEDLEEYEGKLEAYLGKAGARTNLTAGGVT